MNVPRGDRRAGRRLTADGGSLGQDGDGSHGGVLQLVDGAVLGPPAVGADPQEVTDLVGPLTGVQDPPGSKHKHTVTGRSKGFH